MLGIRKLLLLLALGCLTHPSFAQQWSGENWIMQTGQVHINHPNNQAITENETVKCQGNIRLFFNFGELDQPVSRNFELVLEVYRLFSEGEPLRVAEIPLDLTATIGPGLLGGGYKLIPFETLIDAPDGGWSIGAKYEIVAFERNTLPTGKFFVGIEIDESEVPFGVDPTNVSSTPSPFEDIEWRGGGEGQPFEWVITPNQTTVLIPYEDIVGANEDVECGGYQDFFNQWQGLPDYIFRSTTLKLEAYRSVFIRYTDDNDTTHYYKKETIEGHGTATCTVRIGFGTQGNGGGMRPVQWTGTVSPGAQWKTGETYQVRVANFPNLWEGNFRVAGGGGDLPPIFD